MRLRAPRGLKILYTRMERNTDFSVDRCFFSSVYTGYFSGGHTTTVTDSDEKRTLIHAETDDQRRSIQISAISVLFSGQFSMRRVCHGG